MSQNVNVNLVPGNYPKEFHVSQYDVGRQLVANIVDNTGAYSIPSGATVTLVGTKPSGFGFTLTGSVGSGGVVTFSTTATVTAEYGRIPCEIRITSGSTILGTANCMLIVEESPHPEGTTDGDGEVIVNQITLLLEQITQQADRAEASEEAAAESAAEAAQSAADAAQSEDAVTEMLGELRNMLIRETAEGPIASFSDGGRGLPMDSLVAKIEPVQSGSGDPSPTNVRPISGWTAVKSNVAGKNLIPTLSAPVTWSGVTYTPQRDGSVKAVGTSTGSYAATLIPEGPFPAGDYVMSAGSEVSSNGVRLTAAVYAPDRTRYYENLGPGTVSFTVPPGSKVYIYMRTNGGNVAINATVWPMLRIVSDTDPTFEPYTGKTYTSPLGRTVYGGTLDVVSGELVVYPYYASYNGQALEGEWVCDRAVYAQGATPPTGSQVALISGAGTTYQLTPQQVTTLLGQNNVWADSGDVKVVYLADLKMYIDNLVNG